MSIVYKICGLASGLLFCYFGYKLYSKGITKKEGEMNVETGKVKLSLRNVAPGIFFSVLGAFIVLFTIFKGFTFTSQTKGNGIDNRVELEEKSLRPSDTASRNFTTIDSIEVKKDTVHKNK
jgi:hypothetical protein